MTDGYESLRQELAVIAPWIIPVVSTYTAAGAATYGVDTLLWSDSSSDSLSPDTATGMWVFRPDAAAAGDRERRVGGNSGTAIDTSTGRLYQGGASYSNSPAQGEQYELHCERPRTLFNILVRTMEEFYQAVIVPVSRFTDADMETSGTSNYSISGAGSISKVTTAANVPGGSTQSLFFNAGTAGEYVESPTIRVVPGQSYFASSIFRADVGTGYFAVWDKSNDLEIGSRLSHSLERFMSVQRQFSTPTNCEEISLRIYCSGATDDIYIGPFNGPYKASDLILNMPTWANRGSKIRKLSVARYLDSYGSGVYDTESRVYEEIMKRHYALRVNSAAANPYRLELRNTHNPMQELWLEGIRKASEVTTFAFTAAGETSPTTEIDKHTLALAWARNVSRFVLSYQRDDEEAKATLAQANEELGPLMRDYLEDLETPSQPPRHPLVGSVRG
jgi:hypothetical protein